MLSLDCLSGCSHLCCSSMSSSLVGVIAASYYQSCWVHICLFTGWSPQTSQRAPAGMRFGGWGDFAPCLPVLLTCLLTHSHRQSQNVYRDHLPPPQPYKALSDLSHLPSPSPLLFHSMSSHNFSYSTPGPLGLIIGLYYAEHVHTPGPLHSPVPLCGTLMPWDVCTVYFLTFFSSSFKCHQAVVPP